MSTELEVVKPGSGLMFDKIAARYDFMNRVMSFGVDKGWRKRTVKALALGEHAHVLDLATGTADLAIEIARRTPGSTVIGIDPSAQMLAVGQRKIDKKALGERIKLEVGDAQALQLADDSVDAATIAFGIRNVPDRVQGLREMARVVRPGGRIAVLELGEPRHGFMGAAARFHVRKVIPRLGALLSGAKEYRYLQSSIAAFPAPDEFATIMASAGLRVLEVVPLTFGVCTLFVATPAEGVVNARASRLPLPTARGVAYVSFAAPVIAAPAIVGAFPEQPMVAWTTEELTLVGVGIAHELRGRGETRWAQVIAGARELASVDSESARAFAAETGGEVTASFRPRFLGGAAFAPGAADAAPWQGFGDAWFALPRWTYVSDGTRAELVLAVSGDDHGRWREELARFRVAFERPFVALPQPELVGRTADTRGWCAQIEAITDAIARGECTKIVAARTCDVQLAGDVRVAEVLANLDARHAECARVLVRPPEAGTLIAATPERLVRRQGEVVSCDALAGTIARDLGPEALLASGKDRNEHAIVVDAIRAALEGADAQVSAPAAPAIRALRQMLHLHTPIRATLRQPRHVLELAARLHPTPAMGGTPTSFAVDWIVAHEQPRGWYSAPVGWFDLDGNGELAVAIRMAVFAGAQATLYAGCGVVSGSDPDRELAETEIKLQPILGALR